MATKVLQPPSHLFSSLPRITNTTLSHRSVPDIHLWTKSTRSGGLYRSVARIVRVAEPRSGLDAADDNKGFEANCGVSEIKADLYKAVEGINRGIFGVPSAEKSEIHGLVDLLESQNPTPDPTLNLDKVSGCWKLVYSTITILGSKRTKLGLRDFITLGDFYQKIDVAKGKAANVIKFNVRGLKILNGELMIEASFKISTKSRVDISYEKSTITPDQLMNVFRKNYDLLLGIFNPDGWLEITYVDEEMRIGRDANGNIFILERSEDS